MSGRPSTLAACSAAACWDRESMPRLNPCSSRDTRACRSAGPRSSAPDRLLEATARVWRLYDAWGKKDKAAEWCAKWRPATPDELFDFVRMSYDEKRYATAAGLLAEAFRAAPKLGDDRNTQVRYHAACFAARRPPATAWTIRPVTTPPGPGSAARRWAGSKAERDAWTKLLDSGRPEDRLTVVRALQHWQKDPDLAGVRDREPLAKLPEAERREWQSLWATAEALVSGPKVRPRERSPCSFCSCLQRLTTRVHFAEAQSGPARLVTVTRSLSCGCFATHFNLIEHPRVIKRSHADPAMAEGAVVGRHGGVVHVVEENLDQAVLDLPHQPNVVPAVGPGCAFRARLGNRDPRLAIHQENAVGMLVGRFSQVNIVEMTGILMPEEKAEVAMPVIACR